MTKLLTLPGLVAGWDLADDYVRQLGDIHDETVTVDARELVSGTRSFAAQLVVGLLRDGGAKTMTVVGAPASFVRYLRNAAVELGLSSQLDTRNSLHAAVV